MNWCSLWQECFKTFLSLRFKASWKNGRWSRIPTIEFGWNFTPGMQDDVAEERIRPNFKVAVYGEYGFNICDSYSDFMDVALGVKFTVSVQGRAK